MKHLKTHNNILILVSDIDYEYLSGFTWHIMKTKFSKLYVRRWDCMSKPKKAIFMHREILNAPSNMQVDHIDNNTLNNTRENLRLATKQQNCFNRKFADREHKGISMMNGLWHVQITDPITKKKIHLGNHLDKIEALKEYDIIAKQLHGEYAKLNFKDVVEN